MDKIDTFTISLEMTGRRLDVALKNMFPDYSRAFFQRGIKEGRVKVDGEVTTLGKMIMNDEQVVEVTWPALQSSMLTGEDLGLDILFEDEHMLVVNKRPGLVVHPGAGNTSGTLVNALLHHDKESFGSMVNEELRPGIVHRLDKDTSGVLVIGKNEHAVSKLSESFQKRVTKKLYLALVNGFMGNDSERLESLIGRCPFNRKRMVIVERNGKEAITRYKPVAYNQNVTLLKVGIETGRTHQIRVHMSSIGHPVVGDEMYAGKLACKFIDAPRQMLHAWRLAIPHPVTGRKMKFEAPLPEDFIEAMSSVGIQLLSENPFIEE